MVSARQLKYHLLELFPLQIVYVMCDLKFRGHKPFLFKVGISSKVSDARLATVQQSIRDTKGQAVSIRMPFLFPVFNPLPIEKAIHEAFARFRSFEYAGSNGGTEWFAWHNWFSALLTAMFAYGNNQPGMTCIGAAAAILLVPIPFDGIICVFLLGAFQWVVVLTVLSPICWAWWSFLSWIF